MKGFVSFFNPGGQTDYLEVGGLSGKTAAEIEKKENAANILFIKTPNFMKRIKSEEIPLDIYPKLILSERKGMYHISPYMLTFMPRSYENFEFISISPKCKTLNDLPNHYIKINIDKDEGLDLDGFIKLVVEQFSFNFVNPTLAFGDEIIDRNTFSSVRDFIARAENEEVVLNFEADEEMTKIVKKRINIVREIVATEEKYISDLKTLIEFWLPKLQSSGKIEKEDLDTIFKNLPPVFGCHSSFYDDIKDCTKYSSCLAPQFIKFAPLFKFAQTYIATYPTIQGIIKTYEDKTSYKNIMKKLQAECGERDLASYLITPIQRMPRYILFLRDLVKVTRKDHPDYDLISIAFNEIDKVTKEIDVKSNEAKLQKRLLSLQENVKEQLNFINNRSKLITEIPVTVTDKQDQKNGFLLLFDDYIIILKEGSKGDEKLVFDSELKTFPYFPGSQGEATIIIDTSDKVYSKRIFKTHDSYVIDFGTQEKWEDFYTTYRKRLQGMMLTSKAKMTLEFTNARLPADFQAFSGHRAIRVSQRVYIFSGKNFNTINSISIKDKSETPSYGFNKIEMNLPALKGPCMTTISHSLCIISMMSLHVIEARTNKLTTQTITGSFTPRLDATVVSYNSQLYVFGGKSTNGDILGDLQMIAPDTSESEEIKTENGPSPRYLHSACLADHKMYVFGGITANGVSNDLFVYDIKRNEWEKIENNLKPSAEHSCVKIGDILFFIGGTGGFQVFDTSATHENNTFELYGNVPVDITKTQAIATDKTCDILVIGGLVGKNKTPAKAVWLVNVPSLIKKKERSSRKVSMGTNYKSFGGHPIPETDYEISDSVIESKPVRRSPSKPKPEPAPAPASPIVSQPEDEHFILEPQPEKVEEEKKPEEEPKKEEVISEKEQEPAKEEPKQEAEEQKKEEVIEEPKKEETEEPKKEKEKPAEEEKKKGESNKHTAVKIVVGIAAAALVGAAAYIAYKRFRK